VPSASLARAGSVGVDGLTGSALGTLNPVPYPPRPQLRPLPEFAGTARTGTVLNAELQARLETFIVDQYAAGRSLRQIAELVDRSQTAVRRALDKHQVHRRPSGAHSLAD
jgi:hypothetical protein